MSGAGIAAGALEYENGVSHADLITRRKDPFTNRHAADEGIVATLQIHQSKTIGFLADDAMAAGDEGIQKRDVIGGIAPNGNLGVDERKDFTPKGAAYRLQPCGDACYVALSARGPHNAMSILGSPILRSTDCIP